MKVFLDSVVFGHNSTFSDTVKGTVLLIHKGPNDFDVPKETLALLVLDSFPKELHIFKGHLPMSQVTVFRLCSAESTKFFNLRGCVRTTN